MRIDTAFVIKYDDADMLATDNLFKDKDAAERKVRKLSPDYKYVILPLDKWIRDRIQRARDEGYNEGSDHERSYQ